MLASAGLGRSPNCMIFNVPFILGSLVNKYSLICSVMEVKQCILSRIKIIIMKTFFPYRRMVKCLYRELKTGFILFLIICKWGQAFKQECGANSGQKVALPLLELEAVNYLMWFSR